ncbi:MAG: FHIPEP family type III secretion protein, partial [Acidobacteria bacterium]|nr:FHIPEP family type III secretion protein [Acidobacteriota bacterium]
AAKPAAARESLEALLKVEPMAVEVGLGLVDLVEGGPNSPLLRRIGAIRKQLASELGYILPPVRVTDNLSLKAREYQVSLKGVEIARFDLPQGFELAIQAGPVASPVEGLATREPAFGIPAIWVPYSGVETARNAGYTVVDVIGVLGTHLSELARRHAYELYSRQDAKKLLDRVAEDNPKLVEDLVPKTMSLGAVQKVVQNLLRERVSVRDAASILEALGEGGAITKNPTLLTEYVRQSIRRMVVKPYLNPAGELAVHFLDPGLEQQLESAIEHGETTSHLNLSPQRMREVLDRIGRSVPGKEMPVVALVGSGSRYFLKQIAEAVLPNLVVLSHNEVPAGIKVISLGVLH